MANRTIEARLRLAADLAQGIRALRELRREALDTREAVEQAASGGSAGDDTGARGAAAAERDAARQTRLEARRIEREQREAQRAQRLQEAAELRSARQAAREAQRKEREEAKRLAREQREAHAVRIRGELEVQRNVRATANLQKEAYRQLPAQVTDIVTGLASGQSAFQVAIQQGGQLRDSWGGLLSAGRALLSVLTPMRLLLGGVAAAFGLVAYGAAGGYRETDRLNKSLALTGNVAGQSLGTVSEMAQRLAEAQGVSIGSVRDTLEALIATGRFTGATLESAGRAVTVLRMLTGLSAEEALRTFDGQAESVTQWAIKTNRAYNFLTAAQVSYIRTLQAQGRDQEAVRLANDELAKTLESRSIPAIGALERAWNQVAAALGKVKDNVLAIGRPETVDEQVRTLQQRIASLTPQRDRAVGRARGAFDEQLNAYQAELDLLLRLRNADALRRAERAAAVLEEQREIERQSKQHQDALAGLAEAGARARTAALLAALDREQAAVESADARGLLQAEQKAARLNAIEQRRLRAQAALLERQREIEAGRTTETPTDEVAKQTALTGLEAQLTELRARIAVAESQAVDIVEAAALQRARERAERWGEIWKKVLDGNRELQQRAEEARAQSLANPAERAEEAARLATAELRRQADELQAAARAQVSDSRVRGEGDPLQRELDRNIELNRLEQERVAREARMAALRDAADEQLEALALKESALDLEVQRGALNAEEAERRKFEARRQALPQLEAILQLLREMAATPAEANAVEQAAQRVKALGVIVSEAERFSRDTLSGGLATLFNDIATGAETAEIAVKKFFVNMLKAALNFIAQRLGMRIAESLIATGSASGGWFASLFHAGGVVGHSAAPMRRVAPAALLAGAQVLHAGGVAGLAADEQLAILRKGEEVLTRSDPRHVFNGGAGGPVIGQLSVKVDTGTTGTAAGDQQMADALARGLRGVVQAYVAEQMRPGGLLEARRGGV